MMRASLNEDRTPKQRDSSAVQQEFFNRIGYKQSFGSKPTAARLGWLQSVNSEIPMTADCSEQSLS